MHAAGEDDTSYEKEDKVPVREQGRNDDQKDQIPYSEMAYKYVHNPLLF